jgi:hypothetical protein
MTFFDFLLSKQMKQRKLAKEIGLESGLFVMCPICHEVTEAASPSTLRPGTESLVRELLRHRDPRVELFDFDADEILQVINQVSRDLPYRCNCHSL